MSRFRHVELQYASRLLNHGPTILITSYDAASDRRNVMAAAWSMPVEFAPPRVAIVVDKSTWTREIIERNGTFGIVVPGVALDAQGGRLGHGRGHLDRLLAQSGALLVGLCFENRLVEAVPMEPHDVRMDVVATEKRMLYAPAAAAKLERLLG